MQKNDLVQFKNQTNFKNLNKIRIKCMIYAGISMMFYNKLRLMATLTGVLFAVLLSNFALGTFLGLLQKNAFLADHSGADIWILPLGFRQFGQGDMISTSALYDALTVPGVEQAHPLLFGARGLDALAGKKESVQVIGVAAPYNLGGPWNIVAGNKESLSSPNTIFVEGSQRELFGNINLGDVRELGGRNITVGGFTSGLLPFGPSYAFADFELAREILNTPHDRINFVLVKTKAGFNVNEVASKLRTLLPENDVRTKQEFKASLLKFVLVQTPIGVTFSTISFFGILVGTIIVSLTTFQSVVDNIKEFGTLKAIGANMTDLTFLMFSQAVVNALVGTILGVSLVTLCAVVLRSPKMALQLPWQLTAGTFIVMFFVCTLASFLGLLKLRKVEPAMVFR
jgi:putative ABC transport system permease protein